MRFGIKPAQALVAMSFLGASLLLGVQAQTPAAVTVQRQGNVVNVNTVGNLAATQQLLCIDLAQAKNTYTPPDLHTAIRQCLAQDDFDRAAQLFALSGVYAKFDADRVIDPSAKDGGQVLILQTFSAVTPAQKGKFRQALSAVTNDPQKHAAVCAEVQKVGPPNYFPTYLVLHGLNVMLGKPADASALVANFDAAATWSDLQGSYLMCAKQGS